MNAERPFDIWVHPRSSVVPPGVWFSFLPDRVQVLVSADVEDAVGDDRRAVDGAVERHARQQLLLAAGSEDDEGAALVTDVHLPVRHERRSPGLAFGVVRPDRLAGLGV